MAELTEQSELEAVVSIVPVVKSENDLDFTLNKFMDILIVNYLTCGLAKCYLIYIFCCTFCD